MITLTVSINGNEVSREYARNTVDWNLAVESMLDTLEKSHDQKF